MKARRLILVGVMCLLIICGAFVALSAKQTAKDSTLKNTNNSGIPNSGNTLQNNNGPESPHTSFPVQSTDPGPLFHGPSGVMFDSIPNPQRIPR
jgi:hypothetical protein